ncbi:MAG: hypothetical protein AB8B60_09540 [Sulfitobacter sp.]
MTASTLASGTSGQSVRVKDGTLRRMKSNGPSQKVAGASVAAAIVQLLVWLNKVSGGSDIPIEVVGALTVIASFAVGYLVPPGKTEEIVEVRRA